MVEACPKYLIEIMQCIITFDDHVKLKTWKPLLMPFWKVTWILKYLQELNFSPKLLMFNNQVNMKKKTAQNFKELSKFYQLALQEKNISTSEKEKKEIALLYNNLGHSKYMQVLFDDAVEDYTKAIQFDRTLAVAYYNRGTIYYRMEKTL
ncbi:Tetratricopeptide repeat protein 32 [Armadillidium nasatum]|uniref:Tetratricopeptide repeat protein 32 n=1 Tax=Armadillidium nasatum TaxID=96803 RepID=A0A5N5T5Q5_9CRUS|nr:Tetratricopeptide repeat protein 32 [Armadillidium nasatum]